MRALSSFFASLGIASYPAGQVPTGAAFPLLTWEATAGRFGHSCAITATAWFEGEDANILRAAFLDTVLEALPEGGLRLEMPRGFLVAERAGDFLQNVYDQAHPGLLGGRIRLTLRRYGAT